MPDPVITAHAAAKPPADPRRAIIEENQRLRRDAAVLREEFRAALERRQALIRRGPAAAGVASD